MAGMLLPEYPQCGTVSVVRQYGRHFVCAVCLNSGSAHALCPGASLFINLLTDSLPAIAIGMEPQEEGLLDQPPRDPKGGNLTAAFLLRLVLQWNADCGEHDDGVSCGMDTGGAGTASTMAFSALTLARLFHGFNCRSSHSL